MKTLLLLTALTLINTFTFNAQDIEGIYTNRWESNSGESLAYTLTLKEDSTFQFQSDRTLLPPDSEVTAIINGTWHLEGRLLVLKTDDTDDLAIQLNNTKAKYVSISPRNPNFNLVQPSLQFYQSDVFYAKNMELHKEESTVSSIQGEGGE